MVERATNKDAVGQLSDLDGEERKQVPVVVDCTVEREKRLQDLRDAGAVDNNVRYRDIFCGGNDESGSLVAAVDGDGQRRRYGVVVDGGEAASERIEVVEGLRERCFEGGDEEIERGGGFGEEKPELDVLNGKMREIPRGEMDSTTPSLYRRHCRYFVTV